MALIKISDKHSNLKLRFEHPIVLNPNKKYKLGVSHLMFSLRQTFFIKDFWFDILILIPATDETIKKKHVSKNVVTGSYTIAAFEKELQAMFNVTFDALLAQMIENKKDNIIKELKAITRTSVKFRIQKINNNYVLVFNIPFPLEITNFGNFSKVFKFEKIINQKCIIPRTDYISESITEIVKPLSLIEWHCNITEYSYSNHDDHLHIHKHEELLHISFIDNNFYENPAYKEKCTKIMFIPLRKGLQEIREIVLTFFDENNKKLNLKNLVVYLQLKEENK